MRVGNEILTIVVIEMIEEARNDFSRRDLKEIKSRSEIFWKLMIFDVICTNNFE
jgi:hypothetical protein